jgi:hypothetical protein
MLTIERLQSQVQLLEQYNQSAHKGKQQSATVTQNNSKKLNGNNEN